MLPKTNRRKFITSATLSTAGLVFASQLKGLASMPGTGASTAAGAITAGTAAGAITASSAAASTFIPTRAASWWCSLTDLQWPQKSVVDKIKRRADGFAKAKIDTAINFGFHNRFDFSNYFGHLHQYYADVAEQLHQRGIRWMDHYSCNHVTRPRTDKDFHEVNSFERHAVLLIPDENGARIAQYEGHLYQDICEVDLRTGGRGYARQYQFEAFCHNNPGLHDMHGKYLERLKAEVPFDAIEVDDMCSYPGNTTCGCKYCRERFLKDYGHTIPDFGDASFFGDTSNPDKMLYWGNYENPVFRDWLRMKSDSVRDHVKLIKSILGDKPLMTCCSNTGPIVLNAVALDLEKMAPHLDLFMLENVGTTVNNADWLLMEAEALHQKDIAAKTNNAPAIALSYELTHVGAYLGWALARFWGVANWSSTLPGRLVEDPQPLLEMEDAISKSNNWEKQYSDLNYRDGKDIVEVRVVNNALCRENGWRDADGKEHWDRSSAWARQLAQHNVGYRFVRSAELADAAALLQERTPITLDGVGCVSDKQFEAIKTYLSKGGAAWMALPFGTHDEKGFKRKTPLSDQLLKAHYKNLHIIDTSIQSTPLEKLIAGGKFSPIIKQTKGDPRWAVRLRVFNGKPSLHFMNTTLVPVPDSIKDEWGAPMIKDIDSPIKDNKCAYEIDTKRFASLGPLTLMSPEWEADKRTVKLSAAPSGRALIETDLEGAKIYAVAQ